MSPLRVIGGTAKGRKLRLVPGRETRPIPDRVKQALFSILGPDIEGARFLDLFAGTGGVAIEALSRGAEKAVLVDTSRKAIETIHANLELTGLREKADVQRMDAFGYLGSDPAEGFDYVYVAPPQYRGLWMGVVRVLDERTEWLNPDGWAIAQIHPREYEELSLASLVEFDSRRYGSTMLVFYELPGE